uniref:hypothetical protein n=1 Tax=Clostridioides difficile TaxID=1496 RepID=UPI0031B5A189
MVDIMVVVFILAICIFLGIMLIGPRVIGSGEIGIVEKKFSKNFLKDRISEKAKAYGSAELLITKEIAIAVAEAIKEGNVDIVPKNVISNGNMDSCNSLGNLVQLVTLNKLESNEYLKKEKMGNPIDLKEEIINVTEESLQ